MRISSSLLGDQQARPPAPPQVNDPDGARRALDLAREILRYEPGNSLILEYSRTLAELSALQDAEAKAADSEEEEEEEEDKGEEEEGDEKEDDDEGEGSSEDEGKAQDVGDSLGHSIRDERKPAPSVADHERRLYALLEEAERDKVPWRSHPAHVAASLCEPVFVCASLFEHRGELKPRPRRLLNPRRLFPCAR